MPVRIGWGKGRENLPLQVGESPWESPGGKLVRIYRLRWGKEGENSQRIQHLRLRPEHRCA